MQRTRLATVVLSGIPIALLLAGAAAKAGATDYVVSGTQLSLHTNGNATRGSLSLTLRDAAIPIPAAGSADDPSASGVTLTVFARGTSDQATMVTRAESSLWSVRTAGSGAVTYRFRDAAASFANANLLGVNMRTGRGIKLDARTAGIWLGGIVDAVAVRVAWGATRVCTVFDGAAVRRTNPIAFVARAAAAPSLADCDDSSLAPPPAPTPTPTTCEPGGCPGGCPAGTECSPGCECVPVDGCPGGCPEGWICAYPTGGGTCMPPFCDGTSPSCGGTCDQPGTECSPSPVGLCFCLTPCSGGEPYPTCGGSCPDPLTHCIANQDRCSCV